MGDLQNIEAIRRSTSLQFQSIDENNLFGST